jgi:hypothetical protein
MNCAKKQLLVMLALGVGVFLRSCSYGFDIKPAGHLGGPIIFAFYDESNKSIVKSIRSFVVSERTAGRSWSPVWVLNGKAQVKEITYGAKAAGLEETVAARKLLPGKVYGAFASDGSGGSGGGPYFGFSRDGSMVFSKSPDALP